METIDPRVFFHDDDSAIREAVLLLARGMAFQVFCRFLVGDGDLTRYETLCLELDYETVRRMDEESAQIFSRIHG